MQQPDEDMLQELQQDEVRSLSHYDDAQEEHDGRVDDDDRVYDYDGVYAVQPLPNLDCYLQQEQCDDDRVYDRVDGVYAVQPLSCLDYCA